MAAPYRTRTHHHNPQAIPYNSNESSESTYARFPASLPADSAHTEPGFEQASQSDARDHVNVDALEQAAVAIQQHGYMEDNTEAELQTPSQDELGPGEFDMLPPAPSLHASWQALHDYAQSHASQHGYALSINTTAKNRSRIKLACVCYGKPKNTHKLTAETRVRKNRVSYKTGCRMWVEGKRQEDGSWLLRVGESQHNHPGRPSEGWALQRKRTWGVVGGRIGVGGVTAKEELAKTGKATLSNEDEAQGDENDEDATQSAPCHSLERGGLVWKIVEQEMLRKVSPGQGRDRGVGRTVEVLKERLPGIHIFKRDVYNIRAEIKRARKAAGQQVGDGINSGDEDTQTAAQPTQDAESDSPDDEEHDVAELVTSFEQGGQEQPESPPTEDGGLAQIDPVLMASHTAEAQETVSASDLEIYHLRKENAQLKLLLAERTKALKEKTIELGSLQTQAEYAKTMSLLPS